MNSMTGYGKGIAEDAGKKITAEIKSVNHRYLDLGLKLPKGFAFLEDTIKKQIGAALNRGHVDVYLSYEQTAVSEGGYTIDFELAQNFLEAAMELQMKTGLQSDVTLSTLLKNTDIVSRKAPSEDEELLKNLTVSALADALQAIALSRSKEGETQKADFLEKLQTMQTSLEIIKIYAPSVAQDYRTKLTARISEAVSGVPVDEIRLATEIALYADRCCIDEEITRLSAHIESMKELLNQTSPVGRQLDFLVQEMNREANTIGSKANELKITSEVLKLKNEIEKIREQAQNVE